MFHFDWPWILFATPLPWLLRRLLPAAPQSISSALFIPFASAITNRQQLKPLHTVKLWMAILCWLLLLLAATRPQWLGEPLELPESGRNLLLAIDVSGSMEQVGFDSSNRNRLDIVKEVATDFIKRREGDRIALILFGSQAYLQTPFTFDRDTVAKLLQESVIGIAGRETAMGDAIGLAVKKSHTLEGEQRMILLTDGANSAGAVSPVKAAELAAQSGLRIHTIGVGGQPRAVRGLLGMRMVNPAQDLDEETLQMIAQQTGGHYFRADDRQALESIYRELDQIEPITEGSVVVHPVDELYPWPLGSALLLSMLLIGLPRSGRSA
ncbi:MAG: VWA domain-containing protein [Gammaproteobacteria bacterium]|jgi:Ca-activated chloride channel family protein|nr:VWA domain-containing protein [Gammaproteobacteria bacterium]MBT3488386.1 VWA domain-containing protein [Gammaproteobacteria bacterium]MBT3719619.1 VWA domain-containing protein [Gammaproteobacteria bacterium]MBT3845061.1 VWA domain-containing protein [Gammaproteobacteria bacterium]MBT3892378.1 VWA domain-containing protein [Gammaproteobacteria bacterium]